MSRWFRFYGEDVLNDPKVQRLAPSLFKTWVNILCAASRTDGVIPELSDLAFMLRVDEASLGEQFDELTAAGLIDDSDGKVTPHNWKGRQFQSDQSSERVKRYRNAHRNGGVTATETAKPDNDETAAVTSPDTETEAETEEVSEANASGADAPTSEPLDERTKLFRTGLQTLASLTGRRESQLRPMLGRWLKAADDDCLRLNRMIEDAAREQVAEPIAFIEASLKPKETRHAASLNNRPEPASTTLLRSIARVVEERAGMAGGEASADGQSGAVLIGAPDHRGQDSELEIPGFLRRTA